MIHHYNIIGIPDDWQNYLSNGWTYEQQQQKIQVNAAWPYAKLWSESGDYTLCARLSLEICMRKGITARLLHGSSVPIDSLGGITISEWLVLLYDSRCSIPEVLWQNPMSQVNNSQALWWFVLSLITHAVLSLYSMLNFLSYKKTHLTTVPTHLTTA